MLAAAGFQIVDKMVSDSTAESLKSSINKIEKDSVDLNTIKIKLDSAKIKYNDIINAIGLIKVSYDSTNKTARFINTNNNISSSGGNAVSLNGYSISDVSISGITYETTILNDPTKYKMGQYSRNSIISGLRKFCSLRNITSKLIYVAYVHGTNGKKYVNDIIELLNNSEYTLVDRGIVGTTEKPLLKGISIEEIEGKVGIIIGNMP